MDAANEQLMKAQTDNLNAQTKLILAQAEELDIKNSRERGRKKGSR